MPALVAAIHVCPLPARPRLRGAQGRAASKTRMPDKPDDDSG